MLSRVGCEYVRESPLHCLLRVTTLIEYRFAWRPIAAAMIAFVATSGAAHAQRAREACDAAASRDGYRIVRRDSAKTNGTTYELPLHVMRGTRAADVICRYDTKRGVAELPQWDERTGQPTRADHSDTIHRTPTMSREAFIARQECENSINSRPGFRVQRLGTPVERAARQWDVPLTVRQDDGTDQRATCRYNAATGTVSLRRR